MRGGFQGWGKGGGIWIVGRGLLIFRGGVVLGHRHTQTRKTEKKRERERGGGVDLVMIWMCVCSCVYVLMWGGVVVVAVLGSFVMGWMACD